MNENETGLIFAPITFDHLPQLLAIEEEAYPDPWTPGMFNQEIIHSGSHFYVALQREAVVGYAGFWLVLDEAHITKFTVAAPYRQQGYGARIMLHLLEQATRAEAAVVRLEVRESNAVARTLYERLGFSVIGARRGYYARNPENAVVMEKWLRPEAQCRVEKKDDGG